MSFGRELALGYTLGVAAESKDGIAERDFLKSRDFSIIFCTANISSLCFAYIASTTAVTIDVTVLAVDFSTARFMEL